MKSRPFLRLMWSPQAGFLVLPLLLAAAWPLVRNHPAVAPLSGPSRGGPASVLWGESVAFALVAGFMSGLITRDLLQAPFAFIVPSLRKRIFLGKVGLAILIAAVIGLRLSATSGMALAPAIASSALLFFAIGASLSDPVFPRTAVWIIGPLLVIPVWEPWHVQRIFESAPLISTVAAFTAAAVLGMRDLDPDTARQRTLGPVKRDKPLAGDSPTGIRRVIGFAQAWRGTPSSGRVGEWVRAVHYENFGSRRLEWPTSVLWAVGLNCGMAYALKNPSFAAVMGLTSLSLGGHRLTGRWAYPIARERRALVAWISSLVDSTAYFALALLVLPAVYALDLPQVGLIGGFTPRYGLLSPLAVAFMAAPVVQWPRVTSSLPPPQLKRFGPLWLSVSFRVVGAIAIMTFVLESLFVVSEQLSLIAAVAAGTGLALAFQYYYWVNLRHHFRGSDLA